MVDKALPGKCLNVYNASFGGGKYVTIMQFKKTMPSDEGRQRQAALLAFSAFAELKHVILVDEDVDIFDINDVMWAMTTRFQADVDLITRNTGCRICSDLTAEAAVRLQTDGKTRQISGRCQKCGICLKSGKGERKKLCLLE